MIVGLCLVAASALSPATAAEVEVDVELVLMVDVSRSMTPRELEIQRRGYAEALRSAEVIAAIRGGLLQRVAVTYIEWAGFGAQRIVVDWRLLETAEDANAFADILTAEFNPSLRRTSIASALRRGQFELDTNAYAGLRRVIDISGDGPNNEGGLVSDARDEVLAEGTIINGLPLMTREGFGLAWDIEDLDVYYRECVIGGPGAFVIPVLDWADFADAVRRKLVLELAGHPPPARIIPAKLRTASSYDCLIGEKIWQDYRSRWIP